MQTYKLDVLHSGNVGHILAAMGLTKALAPYGARLEWESVESASHPILHVYAPPSLIQEAIVAEVQALVDDWRSVMERCFIPSLGKDEDDLEKDDGDNNDTDCGTDDLDQVSEEEIKKRWGSCNSSALRDIYDTLPERMQSRMAPWMSALSLEIRKDGIAIANKARTQLSKTKFQNFFTDRLVKSIVNVNVLDTLVHKKSYVQHFNWDKKSVKTGYDVGTTLKDGGQPQTSIGGSLAHPSIEALILLGLEMLSLRPGGRMFQPRVMQTIPKVGTLIRIPLWTTPLSANEIEAHLYDGRAEAYAVAKLVDNGKNVAPRLCTFERVEPKRFTQRRSNAKTRGKTA